MEDQNDPTKPTILETDEARQGQTSGHVRVILGASMALAVLAGLSFVIYYNV
jgi:hypothetical protein